MSQVLQHKEPRLKELVLWVTTNCNLHCRYCYASGDAYPCASLAGFSPELEGK